MQRKTESTELAAGRSGAGFVTYELQNRLLKAQLALARGRTGEARKLAAEARAKGFGVIAQRCGLLIGQAGRPAVRG